MLISAHMHSIAANVLLVAYLVVWKEGLGTMKEHKSCNVDVTPVQGLVESCPAQARHNLYTSTTNHAPLSAALIPAAQGQLQVGGSALQEMSRAAYHPDSWSGAFTSAPASRAARTAWISFLYTCMLTQSVSTVLKSPCCDPSIGMTRYLRTCVKPGESRGWD
jgi:hypothetical protein